MSNIERDLITLESIDDGRIPYLFNKEMKNIVKNVLDPETNPTAVREITIKVKFLPTPDRATMMSSTTVVSKIAPKVEALQGIWLQNDEKGIVKAVKAQDQKVGNLGEMMNALTDGED